jgi:hypothetical protein
VVFLRQTKQKITNKHESEISFVEGQLKHLYPLLRENIDENANEEVNYTNDVKKYIYLNILNSQLFD